jgi:hypothetical protein
MTKRLPYLMLMLLLSVLVVPLRASPPIGAVVTAQIVNVSHNLGVVVQSARYDAEKRSVIIKFLNTSRHDVTAYNYALRIDYADGTSGLEDRGQAFEVSQTDGNDLFIAGTTREESLFEFGYGKAVSRVVATVDMVAYDDGTAEVVNEAAFNRLVESRKAAAVAMEKISAIFKQALSAGNPPQAALDELQKLRGVYAAKKEHDAQDAAMGIELHYAIQNIRRVSGTVPLDQFQKYIKYHDNRLAAMKVHSELRRTN